MIHVFYVPRATGTCVFLPSAQSHDRVSRATLTCTYLITDSSEPLPLHTSTKSQEPLTLTCVWLFGPQSHWDLLLFHTFSTGSLTRGGYFIIPSPELLTLVIHEPVPRTISLTSIQCSVPRHTEGYLYFITRSAVSLTLNMYCIRRSPELLTLVIHEPVPRTWDNYLFFNARSPRPLRITCYSLPSSVNTDTYFFIPRSP
jgi:hypothetical protein